MYCLTEDANDEIEKLKNRLKNIQQSRNNFSKLSTEIDIIVSKFNELKKIAY